MHERLVEAQLQHGDPVFREAVAKALEEAQTEAARRMVLEFDSHQNVVVTATKERLIDAKTFYLSNFRRLERLVRMRSVQSCDEGERVVALYDEKERSRRSWQQINEIAKDTSQLNTRSRQLSRKTATRWLQKSGVSFSGMTNRVAEHLRNNNDFLTRELHRVVTRKGHEGSAAEALTSDATQCRRRRLDNKIMQRKQKRKRSKEGGQRAAKRVKRMQSKHEECSAYPW